MGTKWNVWANKMTELGTAPVQCDIPQLVQRANLPRHHIYANSLVDTYRLTCNISSCSPVILDKACI